MAVVVKTVLGSHFGVSRDWDVHLGVRAFDPWPYSKYGALKLAHVA